MIKQRGVLRLQRGALFPGGWVGAASSRTAHDDPWGAGQTQSRTRARGRGPHTQSNMRSTNSVPCPTLPNPCPLLGATEARQAAERHQTKQEPLPRPPLPASAPAPASAVAVCLASSLLMAKHCAHNSSYWLRPATGCVRAAELCVAVVCVSVCVAVVCGCVRYAPRRAGTPRVRWVQARAGGWCGEGAAGVGC